MAQSGYTPIQLYYSTTASTAPTAGNLVAGELAINTNDGKLFYKDSSGNVQVIAGKGGAGVAGGSNTQVQYNSSGNLAGSANMTFNGTTLTLANDASISGLTVGKGGGSAANTTVLGNGAVVAINTGDYLTAVGYQALAANTSGAASTAVGWGALKANTTGRNQAFGTGALLVNTTGSANTAVGDYALQANTTASNNTAVGYQAGYSNTTGSVITALGFQALYANTTGNGVTALGYAAGYSHSTGTQNTFVGERAGYSTTTSSNNTFVGHISGYNNSTGAANTALGQYSFNTNTTGSYNVAIGQSALTSNTTASNNTAVGFQAGYANTTGADNIYVGAGAGYSNTTSSQNTAVGRVALFNNTGANNSAFGYGGLSSNTSGGNNTAVGTQALNSNTTASNNTAVGYQAGYTNSLGAYNVFLGYQSGYTSNYNGNSAHTCVGQSTGFSLTTGLQNTFIGSSSGYYVTTGSKNTILGSFTGNQGGLDIRTASNYIVLSDGDGNPRQVIDSSGNVGIGTSSPAANKKLAIYSNVNANAGITLTNASTGSSAVSSITISNSSSDGQISKSSTTFAGYGVIAAEDFYLYSGGFKDLALTSDGGNIKFGTGAGVPERMRIDASGNVGIGTTTMGARLDVRAVNQNAFDLYGSNATSQRIFPTLGYRGCSIENGNTGETTDGFYYAFTASTASTSFTFYGAQCAPNGVVYRVYGNGNVVNLNNSYGSISDIKLKENIVDATPKLDNICKLKVRNFNFIKSPEQKQLGLIAQEVEQIFPSMIEEAPDRDENGAIIEGEFTKNIKYSVFVPMLLKAIQELNAKVTALETQLAAKG